MKLVDEREKYDENAICKAYGKRMMLMPIPFIMGEIIDIRYQGIRCLIAWVIWFIMFHPNAYGQTEKRMLKYCLRKRKNEFHG